MSDREAKAEAFDAWRSDPITKEVMASLAVLAERAKEKWMSASWDKGHVDPCLLADLRARHEVVRDLIEMSFDDLEAALEQPERD